jgi:cyclic beta-1,2-glucan synthetase
VAFLATSKPVHGHTADRTEFLGRNGSLAAPAALARVGLAGNVQPGGDSCAALQVHVDLPADGSEEIVFVLGAAADEATALSLIDSHAGVERANRTLEESRDHWEAMLGKVTLQSPDGSVDCLFNRWLPYQTLSCRIHGRTGLYQSSGAFGFRDQLQDAMAFLQSSPDICRGQILRAAARQFPEGDVLHWWHPPAARGVRTRISDDLVWLAFVVAEYVAVTGDSGVLEETVAYLAGDPLQAGEAERYAEFEVSDQSATVYEHCLAALQKADRRGAHGLPLIGGGDWNDGMNRVGKEGRGESVWLGWFLLATLGRFAEICDARDDRASAASLRERADTLRESLRDHGWDGGWYRRAYYDDGAPLGSQLGRECVIDSIAQSWAVLSGGDGTGRESAAMAAVWDRLVRSDTGAVLLFTPPFSATERDPGYIGAYPPGVRENGGQYTHAAAWVGMAYAALGQPERTGAILNLLNPVSHADSPARADHYRVEPYVIAADVYGSDPHAGRGGWTWYTGSAAWMYRFILEGVLGVTRREGVLRISPCIPPEWPGYRLDYRYGGSVYRIEVVREGDTLMGAADRRAPCRVTLVDDARSHRVSVVIPKS